MFFTHKYIHYREIMLDMGAWMYALIAMPRPAASGLQSFLLDIHAPYSKSILLMSKFIHKEK